MNKPLVTIITPLFNASSYIKETISSVMAQTYDNWEMLVVDDASTDDSYDVATRFSNKEERVKYFRLDKNCGSAAARNLALSHAKGKYVTFLDSDDTLDPKYIEKQVAFIAIYGPIVSSAYRRKTPLSVTDFFVPDKVDFSQILKGNPLSCLTTMYDREVFPDIRFCEDMERHEDYLFWISILRRGYVARGNPEVLATYRLLPKSKNSNKLRLVKPMFRLYHKKIGFGCLKSALLVIRYSLYSRKKYRDVE